jgi:hypothetical protein
MPDRRDFLRVAVLGIGMSAIEPESRLFAADGAMGQQPPGGDRPPDDWPPPGAGAKPVPPRTPRYPLKTARVLRTDAEIAQARANVARYPAAKKLADNIVKAATEWLAWSDAELLKLLTPASVPRAFDVGASIGCPKCGLKIHEQFGTYPWLADPRKPFKLTCPVDGSVYPDNDYVVDGPPSTGSAGQVIDNGYGWLNPKNNERYWFVAHWNHWLWHRYVSSGLRALVQAYTLTGDKRFAHKAAVLLYRIAEVYPAMDHERQSRFGLMQAQRGIRYRGKILNAIWETATVTGFTASYDAIWETLDGDTELQKLVGKGGADVRGFIEANLLEDAIDAYFAEKIRGNFGMHQSTLAHLALVRQNGEQKVWLDGLLTRIGGSSSYTGLYYALYNLVYRDGMPSESAPGYNFLWVAKLAELSALLKKGGRDLFALPRSRSLYDAPLDLINIRRFTPAWGDSGSVYGDPAQLSTDVYQTAYRAYRDSRYARFLTWRGAVGENSFTTFESLFAAPITSADANLPPQRSRVLAGAGVAILCDRKDTVSASLTYGLKAGHGHFDRLNIEIFANNQPMLPDLGYPDAMNDYVSGIYTWSKNTIAHNTVVVDAARQPGNVPGTLTLFADGGFARVLEADGAGTYPQAQTYRRALFQIDAGDGNGYFLDIFDVEGGRQHDYALHGPPGAFKIQGGTWSAPAPGTLAGENVPLGTIYDDAKLGQPGYKGGFTSYTGSGFQHIYGVQRHTGGDDWLAEWAHEKDPKARLRIRTLSQPGQQMLLGKAHVSPIKYPQELTLLIARRIAGESDPPRLSSRFISVIEPYTATPFVTAAVTRPLSEGSGVAVEVRRTDGATDLLLHDPSRSVKRWGDIATDAHAAVIIRDASGKVRRVFFSGGTFLRVGDEEWRASALNGVVAAVDPAKRTLTVRLDKPVDGGSLAVPHEGRIAHFTNALRQTAHPVRTAQRDGGTLTLTTADDLLVGRVPVTGIKDGEILSGVELPLAPTYRGASVCREDFSGWQTIQRAAGRAITLQEGATLPPVGKDLWVVNIAPGDRLTIPALFAWEKEG